MDCPLCSKECIDAEALKRHLKVVHKASNANNTLKCHLCNFQTDKQYFLRRHFYSCHTQSQADSHSSRSQGRALKRSWRGRQDTPRASCSRRPASPISFPQDDILDLHPSPHKWEDIPMPTSNNRIVKGSTANLEIKVNNSSSSSSRPILSSISPSSSLPTSTKSTKTLTLTMELEVSTGEHGEMKFDLTHFKVVQQKPQNYPEDKVTLGAMKMEQTAVVTEEPAKEE